jgi:predicted transcriptional regulator
MSDEKPVPATLESIAQQIRGIDKRFDGIDKRFDELKAQLRTEIESVRGDVRLVAEAVAAQNTRNERNDAEHEAFAKRLDSHDLRILALEPKTPA